MEQIYSQAAALHKIKTSLPDGAGSSQPVIPEEVAVASPMDQLLAMVDQVRNRLPNYRRCITNI